MAYRYLIKAELSVSYLYSVETKGSYLWDPETSQLYRRMDPREERQPDAILYELDGDNKKPLEELVCLGQYKDVDEAWAEVDLIKKEFPILQALKQELDERIAAGEADDEEKDFSEPMSFCGCYQIELNNKIKTKYGLTKAVCKSFIIRPFIGDKEVKFKNEEETMYEALVPSKVIGVRKMNIGIDHLISVWVNKNNEFQSELNPVFMELAFQNKKWDRLEIEENDYGIVYENEKGYDIYEICDKKLVEQLIAQSSQTISRAKTSNCYTFKWAD